MEHQHRRNVTGHHPQQQQRLSGMPCPQCNGFIPISMYQILAQGSIFCPNCGLKLDINRQASSKAIEALQKVNEAQKRVEESSKFHV